MSSLGEFLLARIAEDEEVARAATPGPWEWVGDSFDDVKPHTCPHGSEWTDHGPDLVTAAKQAPHQDGSVSPVADVITSGGYDASYLNIDSSDAAHIARHDPARVLADVEAKRRIIEGMVPYGPIDDIAAPEILRLLALPYAQHPDFDPAWKVT